MITEQEFLEKYDPSSFERPSITADVLVFTVRESTLQILMVRRDEHPFLGKWCLPGSFIGMEETAEEAAARTLVKEAGMEGAAMEQLYTFSAIDRDPRMRIISIAYIAMMPSNAMHYRKGTDAGSAILFDIQRTDKGFRLTAEIDGELLEIGPEEIAFDHEKIIRTALDRMAGKIDYTDIGFNFLEDKNAFTLTDLRLIYDAVKGTEADIGNFRRFIKNRYIITGKILNNREERKGFGRPAATYRYTGVNRQQPAAGKPGGM